MKYEALMDAIYRAHDKEVEQLVKTTHTHLNIGTVQGRRQACEEWLCNQTYESQPKWYDKLVAVFHDLLRAVGLDVKLSDAEVRVVLQDAFKEFGERQAGVRRAQPMFSRSDNPDYKWWEGMDIKKQIESLPFTYWQKPRDFIAEGYVPITRSEADELYYAGLDKFVAHVNIKGDVDTTGNEGLFMRPLSFYGYQYWRYDERHGQETKAKKRYSEYRERYLQGNKGEIARQEGRETTPVSEGTPELKVAETGNRYSTKGEWNNLPIDDTIRNYWKKKVEEQYEHNRTTRENGDVGFADDSRRERDNGIPYPGRLQLGRIFDENVRGLGEETERPQWESVVFAPELIDTPEFKVARDHFSSLGYTTVPISPVPWGMSVNHNLKAVFISPVSGDSFAYFMSHETSHILSKQGNMSIEVIRDGLDSKHPEFIDTAEQVGYNEDQMREEMSASIVGGWDHYGHLLTGTDNSTKIQEARKAVIASTSNKQDTRFQRQEKEAFDEASEPVPPEYDLGAFESKRKEIDDYVKRLRRSLEFPEAVMLARDLMDGKFPGIKAVVRSTFGNSAFGKFIPQGDGNILLKASIFNDIETASKVLAHEIGHLVDYLPNHLMTRGNILGRIASLNRYMKNYLEEFKGAPGLLTKEDKSRLQKEAREQIKEEEKPDEVIVEEIIREIPQFEVSGISPEIILDLMKGRVEGTIAPELYEYLQRAETKEKKQIVLKAMKDIIDERVAQFGTKKQVGTETVKETVERVIPGVKYDQQTIYKRFKELLQKEINKRVLYRKEVITDELKKLTKLWTPFDDSVDSSYRKYRWSGKELYADAFSVFINYPELMQRDAPTFYKAFLSWIESKPEVKETYDTYQELATNREAVLERREKYIYEMQKGHKTKEQEIMDQIKADNKISPRNILRELYKGLIDRNVALMEAVKKLKKAGKITAANTLEYFKEERNYLASEADFYLEEVKQKIITPLEKAGFTEDDLGYLGTLMRTATQRRNVANPGGMGGYFSDEQIEHLKTKLGAERFNTLKGFLEKFSDLRQEHVIPKLEEAEMYSEALLNTMKTEKNYLTFNVTKFLDKMYGGQAQSALGKVYHTLGTFQDIQNPFIATIFKDISLMRAAEITMYKKELHKTFSENDELQDQIQPAEKKFNGTAQVFVEPKDPKMGMVSYLKNGKVEAFYITKEIADDFNSKPIEAMHFLKLFNALMMPVKALLVNRNPIWMARNVARDYLGTAQNIPGAKVTNLLPYYRKAFMDAWGEVMQGKKLDVVQQMKKAKMLVIDRQYHLSDDVSDDAEFDKLYSKFGHHGEKQRQIIIEKILQAWDFLGDLGKVSERAGKIAGYRWMKENTNMTEREIGHVVRSRIGTPDVYRRGAWQLVFNNIFLYSNVGKEGFRSSWESFQDDKAAYTWKMVKYSFMPKAVLALAALGAFGDDAEDIIKRISNYDKANYLVIPFGKTADGRAIYLRMPQSYMGQVFGAIAWDLFNLEFKKAFENVAADQPYSFNPVIKAILNWGLYAMDVNPQDWYRGQNIVNRKEWDAGEPYRLMEMSKNTWNSVGGGLLYKFNKGQDPKGVWEQISSLPGLNILGSFLKESNQGLKEEYYKAAQEAKQSSALKSMDKDERIVRRERIKRQISDTRSLYRKGYIDNKLFNERMENLQKLLNNDI
jgi:rubrerythrin